MLPKTRQTSGTRSKVTVWFIRSAIFAFVFFLCVSGVRSVVYAQTGIDTTSGTPDNFGVSQVGQNINVATPANGDLRVLIVRIINVILGFLGLVAVCIVLYAGYLWMTSQGNEEVVAAAKKMLVNGAIGLVIILSAYGVTSYILRSLLAAINGQGNTSDTNPPIIHTYAFSGSLGSIIKDHYPRRDQRDVPRNTSIVVTFGVPVNPASLIENSNRTCWKEDHTGPTTQCKTTSGAVASSQTPLDQIADPYYGDCTDVNGDTTLSMQSECDRLITKNVIVDEQSKFPATGSPDETVGVSAAALTTYDTDRNAFTFVFRPFEYLGSATEDVNYRVRLTTSLTRADTGKSVFETQFSSGYTWDFTTSNILDLAPPHVVDVYPQPGSTVPKNSIIQITFNEAIDPTTVEKIVTGVAGESTSVLLNQSPETDPRASLGSWRLSNGYTVLEFTPSTECGVNSCGEKMFCLDVTCTGASCTSPYTSLLRTADWTQNAQAPFESVPFSGVYDLAFNGLDNEVNNTETTHLVKPTLSTGPVILSGERAPDNYWWSFAVANSIDHSAPYIEETLPGVDTENVSGDTETHIQFSNRMWEKTLENISLLEYPQNVCADAALPPESRAATCEKLDTLWYRPHSVTQNEKTKTYLDHREYGPNNLDLYYIPTIPSSVKSVTQNCVYPGVGPWQSQGAAPGSPSACKLTYDAEGNVVSGAGCVGVTQEPTGDTGCVYTLGSGAGVGDATDPIFRTGTVEECVDRLHLQSPTSY